MKYSLIVLIWCFVGAIVCIWLILIGGCVQVIHETTPTGTRLKVNTFLKSVFSDGFYYDPNDGFMEVDKYKGIPSDIVLEYDPLDNTFKFKAEKGK